MKILISFLLLLIICFYSCQKDPNASLPDRGQGVNSADSNLLWRFLYMDTTAAAPGDTLGYTQFVYDAQKRVTGQYEIDITGAVSDTFVYVNYLYAGNDTLPIQTRSLFKETDFADTWRYDTAFYTFD